ncbi:MULTISPECIES: UDP-2,3-diacylglucosamine diphosphatase [Burkholderia]|uniref:UDP-2,3-diacylglucosamine hydrolase n=1 Tax=Burkholderia savannae TaxID=1637837 RepID=A0ABR5TCT0_9BURK|nr:MULTISPECIES: UDP-2,3-diacylglucosamine diphosphatase [Burkholderia]AOJ68450.1 UDP-2,3-diacylglucosamine hydrolase [Burkholderia savannae]AOK46672.1 UDP-2,3-diacylglucosamine hydrolase [Burkholderia sp. MSMB617WGS]KGR98862.1 UDP-2,3-diacylglucosamine diphosphatase [Burkholderia sp. ABCPW 111]KVG46613.1 UDP-2,3-diacylglucosamine hydrolase [Burkholderia sp. MSMB0265]KVG87289.1 UDP-2,3-diacylglucosamine hydrolase [Burkholderia sp. MSMB2040]
MLQETPPRSVFAGVPGERGLAHAARPFLFVSDLHLSEAIPRTVAAFEHFVRVTADSADSVFILGDLFEYWIGDDVLDHDPFAARMAALLRTFSERGIALYVMRGNRDFLLGKRFMKAAGALFIPDPSVVVAFGNRIALAHGDAQCTADRGYQWFRRFARNGLAQRLFLAWPFAWRRALAERMRASSESGRMRPASPRYDVTRKGIAALFKRSGARTIIHGHTHKPARHVEAGGVRWVLPDWELDHAPHRGGYLCVDAQGIRALPLD